MNFSAVFSITYKDFSKSFVKESADKIESTNLHTSFPGFQHRFRTFRTLLLKILLLDFVTSCSKFLLSLYLHIRTVLSADLNKLALEITIKNFQILLL